MKNNMLKFNLILYLVLMIGPNSFAQSFTEVAASQNLSSGYGTHLWFGGGVSFCDFDGDGWDDITLASQNGDPLYFYKNVNGIFQSITPPINHTEESKQVLWADIDNDGDKDFFVTTRGGMSRLFENDGNFTFTDITFSAGIPTNMVSTFGAAFADYNSDGYLDLFIANYLAVSGTNSKYLLKNNGDNTFTDVTFSTWLPNTDLKAFCATFADFNNDLHPDFYVAVDREMPNEMFINNGDGTFTNAGVSSNTNVIMDAMNVGIGDYDNNGYLDIYITNDRNGSVLYKNNGDATFTDVTSTAGVDFDTRIGWGGIFFDSENDGDLDLYVCSQDDQFAEPNGMYVNQGDETFLEPFRNTGGIEQQDTVNSHACARGDYNRDGYEDIAVHNAVSNSSLIGYNFNLWSNSTVNSNKWLKVNLEGTVSNRDGIGVWMELYKDGQKWVRYSTCGEAYLAQSSNTHFFGVGEIDVLDSLVVRWQSGIIDKINYITTNQILNIVEGQYVIPVELVDFTVKETTTEQIELAWEVAQEIAFAGYEIERSEDGRNYTKIGFIEAQNKSSYQFYDKDLPLNIENCYYRLKLVDIDGTFDYSKTEVAYLPQNQLDAMIFPNPIVSVLTIQPINGEKNTEVIFELYDTKGQLILSKEQMHTADSYQWNIEQLPIGTYQLKIQQGTKVTYKEIVKVN